MPLSPTHTQACPPPCEVGREAGRSGREALKLMAAVNLRGSNPLELLMDLVCWSFLSLTFSLYHTHTCTQTHRDISLWWWSHNVMMMPGRGVEVTGRRRRIKKRAFCSFSWEIMSLYSVLLPQPNLDIFYKGVLFWKDCILVLSRNFPVESVVKMHWNFWQDILRSIL